ncbi:MAG TPA: hypothetical protein VKN36_16345 [Eudoraea sp.]|nr:hypothetical protein [Eudoraea sp.]
MSCCGEKRNAWRNELTAAASDGHVQSAETSSASPGELKERVFEYTGYGGLTVMGVSTGNYYHFRSTGDQLKVDYLDGFALMAERDLRIISAE